MDDGIGPPLTTLPTIRLGTRFILRTMVLKKRTSGGSLGRGGFRECGLVHPERADETQPSQCLSFATAPRRSRPRARFGHWIPRFNRAADMLSDVGRLSTRDWLGAPRLQPGLNFGQIPNNAAQGQRKPTGKVSAALHLVNRAIGERYHYAQLLTGYCPPDLPGYRIKAYHRRTRI